MRAMSRQLRPSSSSSLRIWRAASMALWAWYSAGQNLMYVRLIM